MSEKTAATTDHQERIDELEELVTKLKAEAKDRRIRGNKLQEQLDALTEEHAAAVKERDGLKTKAEGGSKQYTDRIAELEAEMAKRDHRDAFRGVSEFGVKGKDKDGKDVETKYTLNEGVSIDDVWSKLGYKPAGDVPDGEKVRTILAEGPAKAAFLFRAAGQGETPKAEGDPSTTAIRTHAATAGPGVSRSVKTPPNGERPTAGAAVQTAYAATGRKIPGRL